MTDKDKIIEALTASLKFSTNNAQETILKYKEGTGVLARYVKAHSEGEHDEICRWYAAMSATELTQAIMADPTHELNSTMIEGALMLAYSLGRVLHENSDTTNNINDEDTAAMIKMQLGKSTPRSSWEQE